MKLKSSIAKRKAQKKFYKARFGGLLRHENIYPCEQVFGGYDCTVVYRVVPRNKNGKSEFLPIGAIVTTGAPEGEVKPKFGQVDDKEAILIQDVNEDGSVNKTLGIQLSDEMVNEMIDPEQVKKQVLPKIK